MPSKYHLRFQDHEDAKVTNFRVPTMPELIQIPSLISKTMETPPFVEDNFEHKCQSLEPIFQIRQKIRNSNIIQRI